MVGTIGAMGFPLSVSAIPIAVEASFSMHKLKSDRIFLRSRISALKNMRSLFNFNLFLWSGAIELPDTDRLDLHLPPHAKS